MAGVFDEERVSAVGLDEVFDEVYVGEVDVAGVHLVHGGYLLHFGVGQREVEDVKVLHHALLVAALGDGDDAALGEPAEGHLRGGLAVLLADAAGQLALDDAVHALSAQRAPSHHCAAGVLEQGLDGALLDEGVALQLVRSSSSRGTPDHRLDLHVVVEVEVAGLLEVAHADGAELAVAVGLLHGAPGAEHVAVSLVDEQQVDVVGLQFAQALVDAAGGALLAAVADPHLGGEEDVLAPDAALCDGLADAFFVEIGLYRVDEAVAHLQRVADATLRLLRRHLERTIAQQWRFHSV